MGEAKKVDVDGQKSAARSESKPFLGSRGPWQALPISLHF